MSSGHQPGPGSGPGSGPEIRDAATLILVRDPALAPRVLMGQRGAGAAFMPRMMVFPGGAVDPEDAEVPFAGDLPAPCRRALGERARVFAAAALRELAEETGLLLGGPGDWPHGRPAPTAGWRRFARAGLLPDPAPLRFVFRAITPPGRPRRFDARFFLADAAALAADPDDFADAEAELSGLRWVPVEAAFDLDLPLITRHVLTGVAARLPSLAAPAEVPFFHGGMEEAQRIERGPAR